MSRTTIEQAERQAAERKRAHNPPAFPVTSDNFANPQSIGMTLRDYFAAKAMQGMMVDVEQPRCDYISKVAYEMADDMLKARGA